MKIAYDLHGVLDTHQDTMKDYLSILMANGNEIIIMSGPAADKIKLELDALGYQAGIHYNAISSVVDFLKATGVKMWQCEKGHWHCADKEWWDSKKHMCQAMEVDILFDDCREYFPKNPEMFHTKFVLFNPKW